MIMMKRDVDDFPFLGKYNGKKEVCDEGQLGIEKQIEEKFDELDEDNRKKYSQLLIGIDTAARSLYDLNQEDVPVDQYFGFSSDEHIYYRDQRMSPNDSRMVCDVLKLDPGDQNNPS